MSRRGAPGEYYEERERERDYYSAAPERSSRTRVAEYDEVDFRERRREVPEFLREDYARGSAGPLVVRDRKVEEREYSRRRPVEVEKDEVVVARSSVGKPREREVEREELVYRPRERERPVEREREEIVYRPKEREVDREEIIYRPREPPQQIAREREEFVYRPRERSPPRVAREREEWSYRARPRSPSIEREQITIRERREEREPPRPRERYDEEITIKEKERERPRDRGYESNEIVIRRGSGSRERQRPRESSFERESIMIKRDERERPRGSERGYENNEIIIRRGSRSRERARPRESSFDKESIVIRRDERERPRERDYKQEEIIIRRGNREKEPSPEREPSPEPPAPAPLPELEPIRAPPIHQEIITHHRHIDHGFEIRSPPPPAPVPTPTPPRARSPPRPRSPSPKSSFEEIEIRRRGERNGQAYDEDIFITDRNRERGRESVAPSRRRSLSGGARSQAMTSRRRSTSGGPRSRAHASREEAEIAEEAEYYNRRAAERAYIGEAYNGATKDWAIVDVPPGTKRVQMDGVGGAGQEVTWQRYNGVRRNKFIANEDVHVDDFAVVEEPPREEPAPPGLDRGRRFVPQKSEKDRMWTEITKDLVTEEAIKHAGYEFEETESFFYVLEYLRYDDVLRLVELTEAIKNDRQARIREIQYEREAPPPPKKQLALPWDEERVFEREVIYERPPPRRYR
ncbi:hypothetical protein MMC20_003328 [Loxospora ochrophaea]|nr:hypothetical protein [Loxospora ochrophaea]